VKTTLENDHILLPGGVTGKLQCPFHGFSTRIAEEKSIQAGGHNGAEFRHQFQKRFVNHQIYLPVNKQSSLLADGFHHTRVTMPGVGHADPAGKIQHLATVHCVEVTTFSVIHDDICIVRPDG